ncbi:hybrid sensor histidine kinase/response regulator [Psychromonas sp. Urea-02u-13]|uniref:hybrid sensor histidine kinase/response regulator n=1 Tax=Psychromonas sp. Urea-02u-13 TaxID=2058326 RepID=UPI000C33FEB6|nr:response regulator [Psychromonas sp. Urea-02u-13]PKG40150.1 hypothetical protein CXF74_04880 [Psychromonas sp. Urea-02u-13]
MQKTKQSLIGYLSIRNKIIISALIPMLLMAIIAAMVYINIEKTISTAKWVEHTHSVTAEGHQLVKLMLDMETGIRGYLITSNPTFLTPLNQAKRAWVRHIEELKRKVADNPVQVARVIEIEQLQKKWLREVADIVITARMEASSTHYNGATDLKTKQHKQQQAQSLAEVIKLVEDETGKRIMDKIRAINIRFIEEENQLLGKRQQTALAAADRTKKVILIGTLVAFLLASLIAFLTSANILNNLKKLLQGTEKIAQGDFDDEIQVSSQDEFSLLAESFNNMSQSLKYSINEMENALQSKGEFLASMSHEIRTPMNGVLGMLGLLLNTRLNKDQHHKASIAQSSAQSLLSIINDILDFSKIEADKLTLESIPFNLRQTLEEVAESLGFQAHEKELELVLDIAKVQHIQIKGDSNRLRQILTNLISNAIKFTAIGEVIIRATTEQNDNNTIQFSCHIIDTGIGISSDKQSSLFDSFTQADSSTTRKYGGTGLGLTICKRLTELMSGKVSISSKPGKGSIFTINIPFEVEHNQPLEIPNINIEGLEILIVDDNKTNREVLQGLLESWGAIIVEAVSAKEALQICQQRSQQAHKKFFDIAFLDMQMPEMDGADLGKKLQSNKDFAKMKLVMMTSIGEQGDNEYFSNIGFSAYFTKPTTTSDLFSALSIIMAGGDTLERAQPLVTSQYIKSLTPRQPTPKTSWTKSTHILIVEDNKVNQMVAKAVLEEYNFSVDIAEHGGEAITKLRAYPYHLVFMDCQMPIMDGYEATRRIRAGEAGQSNSQITIIAMTANAMVGDKDKCFAAGMNDYLSKPLDIALLVEKLQLWVPSPDKNTLKPEV